MNAASNWKTCLGFPGESALLVSAKDGTGVTELLEAIVTLVPPPKGSADEPLKCLIFDSFYDTYRGVIPHIRIFSGSLKHGDKIMIKSTGQVHEVDEVGYFIPSSVPAEIITAGEVGYVGAIIRKVGSIHVGDTIISPDHPETQAFRASATPSRWFSAASIRSIPTITSS